MLGLKGEVWTLKPGSCADIAGLVIEKGDHDLVDVHGKTRHAKEYIRNTFTILNGRPLEQIEHPAPPPRIELVE